MSGTNPFTLLDERRQRREEERMALNKRLAQLNIEADEDEVARKVLARLYPDGYAPAAQVPTAPDNQVPGAIPAQKQPTLTVSEMCLEVVKSAHPEGLTTTQISGKIFLRFRTEVNGNTIRVSMRRHRVRGKARYANGQWIYVPYTDRPQLPAILSNGFLTNGGAHK